MVTDLRTKKCIPCEGGTAPLTREEAGGYLENLSGWDIDESGKEIKREFVFSNFSEALAFVNAVGEIAESEGHHPDVYLHDYKKVSITLSTHAIGGLSENDFIVATKIGVIINGQKKGQIK